MIYKIALPIILFFVACSRVVYLPIERNDSIYINRDIIDSVYIRDSVHVEIGDTIRQTKIQKIYRLKIKRDSIYIIQKDSIHIPIKEEVIRNKTPSWCWWALVALFAIIIPKAYNLIKVLK